MSFLKKKEKALWGLLLSIVIVVADQWSKYAVFGILFEQDDMKLSILPFLNLVVVYNTGVSFGMLNNIPYGHIILSVVATLITLILFVWLYRSNTLYIACAIGLVIGGAIGNIIDRVQYGAVRDFLDFYVESYHWPAFNVADSAVCIGVIMILLEGWLVKKKEEKHDSS